MLSKLMLIGVVLLANRYMMLRAALSYQAAKTLTGIVTVVLIIIILFGKRKGIRDEKRKIRNLQANDLDACVALP